MANAPSRVGMWMTGLSMVFPLAYRLTFDTLNGVVTGRQGVHQKSLLEKLVGQGGRSDNADKFKRVL